MLWYGHSLFLKANFYFNWSIIDLQCCVSFRYTSKWVSHTHTHIYICIYIRIYIYIFHILFPYRLLQNTEYNSLCYTAGPCWVIYFIYICIGEGNGNPLQCSCLENPRDGGAWWAAVSVVAQSRTRLKRLSSSSSRSRNIYLFIQNS